jgi:hypothetical protein
MWPFNKKTKTGTREAMVSGRRRGANAERREVKASDFNKWAAGAQGSVVFPAAVYGDKAAFYKVFLDAITRHVPMVSSAVWVWEKLAATTQSVKYRGGTDAEREHAKKIISSLDQRLSPFPHVQQGGMDTLINQYFHSVFSRGRFAGRMVVDPNGKRVERFELLDPFRVKFKKDTYQAYYANEHYSEYKLLNPNTFYYYALNMTQDNPYGHAMAETATPFVRIADEILADMRAYLGNAGVPRLHIKITQPDKVEGEDDELYRNRVENYFTNTVGQFVDIAADDNVYTWDDVEIGTIGAQGPTGYIWRTNRQILDEEIVCAFHLYPWVMGRSFSTTKNWVLSQFDLLMSQIDSVQQAAKRFSEWMKMVELRLQGITNVEARHYFALLRDPAAKDQFIAQRFRIGNVKSKALAGFISPDDAARELGYEKAHDPELLLKDVEGDGGEGIKNQDQALDFEALSERLEEIGTAIGEKVEGLEGKIAELAGPGRGGKK